MCGIFGLIDLNKTQLAKDWVETCNNLMLKRGPNSAGYYFDKNIVLAMRRLSIIDVAHGQQPFYSANQAIVAFQNGEIYNYPDLKADLLTHQYPFISNCDTEVLAHGCQQWGIEKLLKKIDGMYAIALYDKNERILYLARDRFGEKPLFYAADNKHFAYASDLTILAAQPWVTPEIDALSLERYLALHYTAGDRTFFKNIKRVLPGEYLKVYLRENIQIEKHVYYRLNEIKASPVTETDLADLIEESVKSRLIADVPVGVFLSGGIDSSIVASMAAKHNQGIHTFSMGFTDKTHDESHYAKQMAANIGSQHHHFQFDENHFLGMMTDVSAALDEPLGDQALLPVFMLAKEASQWVKVVLSGEGADEIFAGYNYYLPFASPLPLLSKTKQTLKSLLGIMPSPFPHSLIGNALPQTPSGFPLLLDQQQRQLLLETCSKEQDNWEMQMQHTLQSIPQPLDRALVSDIMTWLPDDLLVKLDRMTMAHSIEGRAPFLNPKIVAAALLGLKPTQKIQNNITKFTLKKLATRWIPQEIIERKKMGFVLPMSQWLKTWFDQQGGVRHYFNSKPVPGIKTDALIHAIETSYQLPIENVRFIFAAIMLTEWYEKFNSRLQTFNLSNRIAHKEQAH